MFLRIGTTTCRGLLIGSLRGARVSQACLPIPGAHSFAACQPFRLPILSQLPPLLLLLQLHLRGLLHDPFRRGHALLLLLLLLLDHLEVPLSLLGSLLLVQPLFREGTPVALRVLASALLLAALGLAPGSVLTSARRLLLLVVQFLMYHDFFLVLLS